LLPLYKTELQMYILFSYSSFRNYLKNNKSLWGCPKS